MKPDKIKILYVENDDGHALLMKLNLSEFDINIFKHYDELFQYLESNFDYNLKYIVLLDIRLPKYDGLTILKMLKKDTKYNNFNIIIVSSSDNPDEINNAFKLGALEFIHKPINFDELVLKINQLFK